MTDSKKKTSQDGSEKQRNVVNCNFRSASRLSNENARAMTSIHETYARHLASTLDAYLGTGVEVKLTGLEQLPIKEHITGIPALTYIVPFSLGTTPGATIVECDMNMVFPIVDLLLGGTGVANSGPRELSEIEEEIMHDVVQLLIKQAESAWHIQDTPLKQNRRVKSSVLHQYCPPNEKVTCVKFEIDIAGTVGSFKLVFPAAFLNILLSKFKQDQPQKKNSVRFFPKPSIRERILDCDVEVAAELPELRVAVRDLLALVPGSVLKLRAPVRTPGMLTAGAHAIFEVSPVRNGTQKAAQLGRRVSSNHWERV